MCNHQFKSIYHSFNERKCIYPNLYEQWRKKNRYQKFDLSLPIDKGGQCIFHSQEIGWKLEHNFESRFFDLLELLQLEDHKFLHFIDFVFVKEGIKNDFKIENIQSPLNLYFSGAVFKNPFCFKNIKIIHLFFDEAVFEQEFTLRNIDLHSRFSFENCIVKGRFHIRDSIFRFNSFFTDAQFLDLAIFYNVEFIGSVFFTRLMIGYKTIMEYEEPFAKFINVTFNNSTEFENTVFNCGVEFENMIVNGPTKFDNTEFSKMDFTVFDNPKINETLSFIGSSTKKMFPSRVSFRVKSKDVQKEILFENVKYHNIVEKDRAVLKQMAALGKVIIGSGCIKYRNQTPTKTINVKQGHQNLALELANTFIHFFQKATGNLGIEVIKRTPEYIRFFYFSDENISESIFLQRISDTEAVFLGMMFPDIYGKNDLFEKSPLSHDLLNIVDTIVGLKSVFLKLGARVHTKSISNENAISVVNVINITDNHGINHQQLLETITKDFSPKTILNFIGNIEVTNEMKVYDNQQVNITKKGDIKTNPIFNVTINKKETAPVFQFSLKSITPLKAEQHFIQTLESYLKKGFIKKAIQSLITYSKTRSTVLYGQLLQFSAQYNELDYQQVAGSKTSEQIKVEKNQMRSALILLVSQITIESTQKTK